ncbi:MAG TPA: zinc ribbon domain-containing protein [Terracidiphilus sp.]|nr:zinc ribbon domain-containing protein [Terracidiphilus sp.]
MEETCPRCHQTLQANTCFCPACGLPQLVYDAETDAEPGQVERWTHAVRDASMVEWKPALRAAIALAVPAGLLSSGISPVSLAGFFWMAAAAAWAVVIYVRSQRPAWITAGAGARIGLVTGILAAWLAFSISGAALYVQRYKMRQSTDMDSQWKATVTQSWQRSAQYALSMNPADSQKAMAMRDWMRDSMLTPWGHAGFMAFSLAAYMCFLIFFCVGGGAVSARMLARTRRPPL